MSKKSFHSTVDNNTIIPDSHICTNTIKAILPSLGIQSMHTDILQIPSENNQFHAVAKHTVTFKSGESYSAIGSALPDDKVSSLETLDKAQDIAFQNAFHLARQARRNAPLFGTQIDSSQPSEIASSSSSTPRPDGIDKSKWNGGGNKPITQNQINLIKRMAGKKNTDPELLVRNNFGKKLEMLNGSEAHEVIGLLNDSVY